MEQKVSPFFLIVLILAFFVASILSQSAYSADDLDKLKADYQNIVNSFTDNLNSQRLLVEGFKSTNSTYQALVAAQVKLQKKAKALADKIKELETPPEPVQEDAEVPKE